MRSACIALACVLGMTTLVAAQERAWFIDGSVTELGISNGGRDWSLLRRMDPSVRPYSGILVGGGRYLVWLERVPLSDARVVVRLDTRTGDLSYLPGLSVRDWFSQAALLAVDRRSAQLVIVDLFSVYLVDIRDHPSVTVVPFLAESGERRSLAVGRGRVFIGRWAFTGFGMPPRVETVILDSATGHELGTIDGMWEGQLSRDERYLVFNQASSPVSGYGYDVEVWDTVTFTRRSRATVVYPAAPSGRLTVLDDMLIARWYHYETRRVHARGHAIPSFSPQFDAEPDWYGLRGDMFHASSWAPHILKLDESSELGCWSTVVAVEAPGLDVVRSFSPQDFGIRCRSTMLMLAPPDAPTGLRATVAGSSVTLEWDPPPDIGAYEIVVGSAPGLSNIGTFQTGPRSFASFDGVPSGTYYVRVRAINELGASESWEIQVVVGPSSPY